MYQLAHGVTQNLADVEAFIETLNTLGRNPSAPLNSFFATDRELTITRAPGRLDVMGGIADYSGSLVLELPIAEATLVALQKVEARRISIISLVDNGTRALLSEVPLAEFERDDAPIEYNEARAYF